MLMLASPKRTITSLPPAQALTTNFLPPLTSRLGLLQAIFDLLVFDFALGCLAISQEPLEMPRQENPTALVSLAVLVGKCATRL